MVPSFERWRDRNGGRTMVDPARVLLKDLAHATNLLLITAANKTSKREVLEWPVSNLLYEILAKTAKFLKETPDA
jgi:hypothetical protein